MPAWLELPLIAVGALAVLAALALIFVGLRYGLLTGKDSLSGEITARSSGRRSPR